MKSAIMFLWVFMAIQGHAQECHHLEKVHYLCILADAELEQAYLREEQDMPYYHGRLDAMDTAYFQIKKSGPSCHCVSITTRLRDKAESQFDHAERFNYWPGDAWYWMGALTAYNDILEAFQAFD